MSQPIQKKTVQRKSTVQITDFLAIALAVLLTPLLIMRTSEPELVQMASDIKIYTDKYYQNVRGPVQTAILNQSIEGVKYSIPHILFPGYSTTKQQSFVDAVAFTGLQREMLYSQRFAGLRYRSPYVPHRALLTNASKSKYSEEESAWKNSTYYFSGSTSAKGRVKTLQQNTETMELAGLTDLQEVFLLDAKLNKIFTNDELSQSMPDYTSEYKIKNLLNQKVLPTDEHVFLSVTGETEEGDAVLILSKIDRKGKTVWKNIVPIKKDVWIVDDKDPMLNPLNITNSSTNITQTPFKVLRDVLSGYVKQKHGQTQYIYTIDSYFVFRSPQLISVFDIETGQEVVSFSIKFGIHLSTDFDRLLIEYISDQTLKELKVKNKRHYKFDVVSQAVLGDSMNEMDLVLNFVSHISEESAAIESQMDFNASSLQPTTMTLVAPIQFQTPLNQKICVFLAPNGMLAAFDASNGVKIWSEIIPDFVASTLNAHLSFAETEQVQLLILTLGRNIYLFAANSGKLMGQWSLQENVQIYDSVQNFYDDDLARVGIEILVERLHPFVDKKAIFVTRGANMDVIGVGAQGVALTNFWERTMLVGFVSVVLALFLRGVMQVVHKKE
ncbi:Transmembrane_domain-containing protein [Hexamita inflata]|uniref:Transmembrane domain-containing protein n=1 Tax=Hexamita inflata TaxID=28002 RepID=A0AA86P0Y3_9EUKA|nr:Transmembrane domain-containing protein [Hexamita inflata]